MQGGGDFHQRFGVNPAAGINEIHVVAVAVQPFRQPHSTPALPLLLGLDQFVTNRWSLKASAKAERPAAFKINPFFKSSSSK